MARENNMRQSLNDIEKGFREIAACYADANAIFSTLTDLIETFQALAVKKGFYRLKDEQITNTFACFSNELSLYESAYLKYDSSSRFNCVINYGNSLHKIKNDVKKIHEERNALRKKLTDYYDSLNRYLPDLFSYENILELLKFEDLTPAPQLKEFFNYHLSDNFLRKIFEEKIYCNDRLYNPQIVTVILEYDLWATLDMPNKSVESFALSAALLTAVKANQLNHVKILLDFGARSYDVVDENKQTTLHLAMKHPVALLNLLLSKDTTLNFNAHNDKRMTAMQVAVGDQYYEAINILKKHLDLISAEEIKRNEIQKILIAARRQKEEITETARVEKETLNTLLHVFEEDEAALLHLFNQNELLKKKLLIQAKEAALEKEKNLLQAYENILDTGLISTKELLSDSKQALAAAEANQKRREVAARLAKIEASDLIQKKLEAKKSQRNINQKALMTNLTTRKEELTAKLNCFFQKNESTRKAELELITKIMQLLSGCSESDEIKHAQLVTLLSDTQYNAIKKQGATFSLVKDALAFFKDVDLYEVTAQSLTDTETTALCSLPPIQQPHPPSAKPVGQISARPHM